MGWRRIVTRNDLRHRVIPFEADVLILSFRAHIGNRLLDAEWLLADFTVQAVLTLLRTGRRGPIVATQEFQE
jgi:hypothetical protein